VDFKNMPNWVKTAVNADGAFKNLKVTRSTPQLARLEFSFRKEGT